jgi:hypothetical protein
MNLTGRLPLARGGSYFIFVDADKTEKVCCAMNLE